LVSPRFAGYLFVSLLISEQSCYTGLRFILMLYVWYKILSKMLL